MVINGIDITTNLSDSEVESLKQYNILRGKENSHKILLETIDYYYDHHIDTVEDTIIGHNIIEIFGRSVLHKVYQDIDGDDVIKNDDVDVTKNDEYKRILSVYSNDELNKIKSLLGKITSTCMRNVSTFATSDNKLCEMDKQFFDDKIKLFEGLVNNLKELKKLNKL